MRAPEAHQDGDLGEQPPDRREKLAGEGADVAFSEVAGLEQDDDMVVP
jgi:hypothetical protein